jgi:hypothetical protein
VAAILVLLMGDPEGRARELEPLRAAGHVLTVIEPRFPERQGELGAQKPDLVLIDGVNAPSHGRAAAGWLANKLRTTPFLFLDVADKDVARVKKEVPRAQFGTWASLTGAAKRLLG